MHFFTSIYGEKYLPFLRVFLRSLTETQTNFKLTVAWDDLPELEIELLARHFPNAQFQRCHEGIEDVSDVHQRIPMKLHYWMSFLESVDEGTTVGFLDVDTLLMQEISDCLPADADVVFTWKVERFPLNTGVVLVRNSVATRSFMDAWLTETNAIIAEYSRLQYSRETYGAADQLALAQLLPHRDFTGRSEKDFGAGGVRFCPASCEELNETNSHPFSPQTKLYHLKSGWHRILLEDGRYTRWRRKEDCEQIQQRWLNHDVETTVDSWRDFCIRTAEKYANRFTDEFENHLEDGILNSEMLAVISMLNELKIDVLIDSRLDRPSSSRTLAPAIQNSPREIHVTGLSKDEIARDGEQWFSGFDNINLHRENIAEVIPQILASHGNKRVAILLDASKGQRSFELFSRAIADHDHVVLGFIQDLRDSYPGMLNPNRIRVYECFERVFLTDDEEFLKKFRRLDEPCHVPDVWEPHYLAGRRIGSYGPTLGVIFPTRRDRMRARKRLTEPSELAPAARSQPQPGNLNPLKKLHRIPGYSQSKTILKRGLGLEQSANSAAKNDYQDLAAGVDRIARDMLAASIDIKATDIVIDCGANVGQEVAQFADTGAMIYAFEPNPHAFAELVSRFDDRVNVVCFPMAVLDRKDTVRLFMHEQSEEDEVKFSTGSSILDCKGNVVTDRYVDVPTIDLSEFVFRLNKRVKLLKMDIEGAEYETLQKLISRGLTDLIDHILVETHAEKIPELRPRHQALERLIESKSITNIDLSWI